MSALNDRIVRQWTRVGPRFLPFADAASEALPLGRLLRLSLFQVSVGMALVLLNGTLNRVMIVELGVPAWLVSAMIALPLLFAPARALVGHRSDHHRSALGWRRVPYLWIGTMLQFGGLAIMPFALLILSGDTQGPAVFGHVGAALAFVLVGAGLHTVQTAGLALATDLAPAEARPRVVALMYVMLLAGTVASALAFGWLLADFSQIRLIQVVQGAALLTMALNVAALWKQEPRDPERARVAPPAPPFAQAWREFVSRNRAARLLVALALGTAAFGMQDILLEPYGGQVLRMSVGQTTELSALLAGGALVAFALAARWLQRGADPFRVAAAGTLAGIAAFAAVVFADPLHSVWLLRAGAAGIGLGGGLFAVGMLTSAMDLAERAGGLALGAWGAVQATAAGVAIACGGAIRDLVSSMAVRGALGPTLTDPAVGYSVVYHLEIALLFATLIALGPLVQAARHDPPRARERFGLVELPG
jgi:BCD family chlorophyll transporter-like MFS transporter